MQVRDVVHIHIPRTAGSSLHAHLAGALSRSGITLQTGHFFWGDHPPEEGRVFFTVLREPVARVVSALQYIAGNKAHQDHQEYHANGAAWFLNASVTMSNFQTKALAGRHTLQKPVTALDLDQALATISRPDVVACSDLDEGLARLAALTGAEIGPLSEHRNTSERIAYSPEILARIAETNQLDAKLWDYISMNVTLASKSSVVGDSEPSVVTRNWMLSAAA